MRTDQSLAPEHGPGEPLGGSPGPPTIAVKAQTVEVLRAAAGWSWAELARRSRLDQSAVARLLRNDLKPGPRSIAGLLLAFSTKFPAIGFYDLFELIDADGTVITPRAVDGAASPDGADVIAKVAS